MPLPSVREEMTGAVMQSANVNTVGLNKAFSLVQVTDILLIGIPAIFVLLLDHTFIDFADGWLSFSFHSRHFIMYALRDKLLSVRKWQTVKRA